MSETGHVDGSTERPDGVTDLLLWKLALRVADAHEPDGEGGCRNLLCAGESWPCTPWNNAQRALRQAQATGPAERTGTDSPSGWSASVVPAARRGTPTTTRDGGNTASAA